MGVVGDGDGGRVTIKHLAMEVLRVRSLAVGYVASCISGSISLESSVYSKYVQLYVGDNLLKKNSTKL